MITVTTINKEFALGCFKALQEKNVLNEKNISCLTDLEWCQRRFGSITRTPVLKEVPKECSDTDFKLLLLGGTNQSRYYPNIIQVEGKKFVVSNYWYGPETRMQDNKTPFLEWVKLQIK